MKRYKSKTPRTAIGFAAFTMTALTLTVLVAAPALFGSGNQREATLAAATLVPKIAEPKLATTVTIIPARIDVLASREAVMAAETTPQLRTQLPTQLQTTVRAVATSVQSPASPPKRKQQT